MNIDISDTLKETKNMNLDFDFDAGAKQVGKVVGDLLNKSADYVIKAMPIPDPFKDILVDIKNSIKKNGLKDLVKTAVNSTIREGLEILNMPKNIIKDVIKIKDVALRGGLKQALGNVIDIVANKYLKNNIVGDFVKNFFKEFKNQIFSKNFGTKLDSAVKKIVDKKDKFLNVCKEWYDSYDNNDLANMNAVAEKVKSKYTVINEDKRCARENNIIQNITKLYNEKKENLSDIELQLCKNM